MRFSQTQRDERNEHKAQIKRREANLTIIYRRIRELHTRNILNMGLYLSWINNFNLSMKTENESEFKFTTVIYVNNVFPTDSRLYRRGVNENVHTFKMRNNFELFAKFIVFRVKIYYNCFKYRVKKKKKKKKVANNGALFIYFSASVLRKVQIPPSFSPCNSITRNNTTFV